MMTSTTSSSMSVNPRARRSMDEGFMVAAAGRAGPGEQGIHQ
jgi:hypothetical protein